MNWFNETAILTNAAALTQWCSCIRKGLIPTGLTSQVYRLAVDIGGIPCNKRGTLLCSLLFSKIQSYFVYSDVYGTVYRLYTTLTVPCNKGGRHNVIALWWREGGGEYCGPGFVVVVFSGNYYRYDITIGGRFHVKGPRKKVNVEKWIFVDEIWKNYCFDKVKTEEKKFFFSKIQQPISNIIHIIILVWLLLFCKFVLLFAMF